MLSSPTQCISFHTSYLSIAKHIDIIYRFYPQKKENLLFLLPRKKAISPFCRKNRHLLLFFYFINFSMKSCSLKIGIPSSAAFLFLLDAEWMSLLIRKLVFFVTLPVTLPPPVSMRACSSLRLAKCSRSPVTTKVRPLRGLSPVSACSGAAIRR